MRGNPFFFALYSESFHAVFEITTPKIFLRVTRITRVIVNITFFFFYFFYGIKRVYCTRVYARAHIQTDRTSSLDAIRIFFLVSYTHVKARCCCCLDLLLRRYFRSTINGHVACVCMVWTAFGIKSRTKTTVPYEFDGRLHIR